MTHLENRITEYKKKMIEFAYNNNEELFFYTHAELINCFDEQDIINIKNLTIEQSNSTLWYLIRDYRLTASIIGSILTWNGKKYQYGPSFLRNHINPSQSYIDSMNNNKYVQYGKNMEPVVRNIFNSINNQLLYVKDSGIIILNNYPWVAVTPDGIGYYSDNDNPAFTIEIKCPSSGINPAERLLDKMNLLPLNLHPAEYDKRKALYSQRIISEESNQNCGDDYVDKGHYYYIQCLYQMYAVKVSHCYFVVFNGDKIYTIKFNFNERFFNASIERLKHLYATKFLPALWVEYKKKANPSIEPKVIRYNNVENIVMAKRRKFNFN